MELMEKVLNTFKPGKFLMTVFANKVLVKLYYITPELLFTVWFQNCMRNQMGKGVRLKAHCLIKTSFGYFFIRFSDPPTPLKVKNGECILCSKVYTHTLYLSNLFEFIDFIRHCSLNSPLKRCKIYNILRCFLVTIQDSLKCQGHILYCYRHSWYMHFAILSGNLFKYCIPK